MRISDTNPRVWILKKIVVCKCGQLSFCRPYLWACSVYLPNNFIRQNQIIMEELSQAMNTMCYRYRNRNDKQGFCVHRSIYKNFKTKSNA